MYVYTCTHYVQIEGMRTIQYTVVWPTEQTIYYPHVNTPKDYTSWEYEAIVTRSMHEKEELMYLVAIVLSK